MLLVPSFVAREEECFFVKFVRENLARRDGKGDVTLAISRR